MNAEKLKETSRIKRGFLTIMSAGLLGLAAYTSIEGFEAYDQAKDAAFAAKHLKEKVLNIELKSLVGLHFGLPSNTTGGEKSELKSLRKQMKEAKETQNKHAVAGTRDATIAALSAFAGLTTLIGAFHQDLLPPKK